MPTGMDLAQVGEDVEAPLLNVELVDQILPGLPVRQAIETSNFISGETYVPALLDLNLAGKTVIGLGVSGKSLTQLILEQGAASVVSFESEQQPLPHEAGEGIEIRRGELTKADLSICSEPNTALIVNLPPSLLSFVDSNIIQKYGIQDVQLMIPEAALAGFPEYRVVLSIDGRAFEPEAPGRYLIVRKGFDAQVPLPAYYLEEIERITEAIRLSTEKYGTARRVVICLTQSEEKLPEVKQNLSRYGIEVYQGHPYLSESYIKALLAIEVPGVTIKGVAKETSTLTEPGGNKPAAIEQLQRVDHTSILHIFTRGKDGDQLKADVYTHRTPGLIDKRRPENDGSNVFGWDAQFVSTATYMSYQQMREMGLKVSSRDQVWAEFLRENIYYTKRVDANFSPQAQNSTVDFSRSVGAFIAENPYINNPVCRELGLIHLFAGAADNGLFFRSPGNRREKNYWLPGLNGGIPLTPKKDPLHEITFTAHDVGHMHIPDLVVSGPLSEHERRVYMAYRMMSEALTIVIADMAFVDTLARSNYEYDFSKRKIYPLFQALGIPLTSETLSENLKVILHANMRYCLRGDDSEYRSLIKSNGANLHALDDFKSKYMPFFVEDFRWTEQNMARMADDSKFFGHWWRGVGKIAARYSLGLETVADYAQSIPTGSEELVEAIFNAVFEKRIAPLLDPKADLEHLSEESRRTKAFARYTIGQLAIFSRYPDMPYTKPIHDLLVRELMEHEGDFSLQEIRTIQELYNSYVDRLQHDGRIQFDDAQTYKGVYPLFEPFYVFYDEDQGFYEDLAAVSQRLLGKE